MGNITTMSKKHIVVCIKKEEDGHTELVLDHSGTEHLMSNILFDDVNDAETILSKMMPNGHTYKIVPIRYNDPTDNAFYTPSKVSRNYTHDTIGNHLEIMKLIAKCFDDNQITVKEGLDKKFIIAYVMKHSKGRYNPHQVHLIIESL